VLASSSQKALELPAEATEDLTIVRLDQRKSAFDDIMNRLDNDAAQQQPNSGKVSEAFFSGNISSLLDVASDLNRIEITRRASPDGMHEEIHFVLNKL
jgi:flagellar hook-basal body complex protein FliE